MSEDTSKQESRQRDQSAHVDPVGPVALPAEPRRSWESRFYAHASGRERPSDEDIARVRRCVREGWAVMSVDGLLVVAAALGALTREQVRRPTSNPELRGTEARPCEYCGNNSSGATLCERGFYRCNTCGEPSP